MISEAKPRFAFTHAALTDVGNFGVVQASYKITVAPRHDETK